MTERLGASPADGATRFVVWAPLAERSVQVHFPDLSAQNRGTADLTQTGDGYWVGDVAWVGHGDRYTVALDGGDPLPDPASAWQPEGVHGPSVVWDPAHCSWSDEVWRGRALADTVLYELHVGTFTAAGTFGAAVGQLDRLVELGVTTIELMPVQAFPGTRNWGYDGVSPFSVHDAYGGPDGLVRFVDEAHARGLAVILDVVFNHLGPEGNYHGRFGPYFTNAYSTPWGPALNVAGPGSDHVRRYFRECTQRWIRDFHIDGFRFDAVHAIVDPTANPFWAQVCQAAREAAQQARRKIVLIGETSDNDPSQLHPVERNGFGFDAVWCDDIHHTLRVATTGDRHSYYTDYAGTPNELADTIEHRWKFRGQYSVARGRSHGRPVDDVAPHRFIVCTQNHDQIGNRPAGDRPDHHQSVAQRRFVAATTLLLPATPMLFMGEEYGEQRPFPFFVDHQDPAVLEATNEGRRAEFAGADWSVDVPEPGAVSTFDSAVIDPSAGDARLDAMYRELLRLRRDVVTVADARATQHVQMSGDSVIVTRTIGDASSALVANESDHPAEIAVKAATDGTVAFASDSADWGGHGTTAITDGLLRVEPWTAVLVVTGSIGATP